MQHYATNTPLSAAAKHFHVSERLIRTLLVNKRTLDRHRLEDFVPGSALPAYESASAQFDAVLDAA